ncbi:NAD-dependent epimerase/dehydratase family protein, partial [Candidatus Pelagibacter ubique]|nr:NAD-dependent epimerase/dehydratase family protein [Candidatus Pelagibacter ubique]
LLELKSLQNKKKFNLSWARVFYIYGENQRKESLYSQIKISIKKGKKNFSLSNGNQKRDYLHVDVLAKKIVKLAICMLIMSIRFLETM